MQRAAEDLRIRVVQPTEPSDEGLFDAFRTRGDVNALGDLFDRVAPAVLRVALHLVRDPAAADDLLQGAFLKAIECRDQWDATRPLLPWLCGVLQNVARARRWQFERQPDAARLPPARASDPAAAAAASEFDAAVDAAIATLPELYRPVLRMHLAYGHVPAEIAHALDRPPATVRSQLARGLEQLRRVLPASFAGALAITMTTGHGLAATRQLVLAHAANMFPVPLAAAGVAGGVAMKKLVGVAAAAGLLAVGAWFVIPEATTAAMPQVDVAPAPVAAAPSLAPNTSTAALSADRELAAAAASPAESTGSLRITCRFEEDGQPARGVGVSIDPRIAGDSGLLQRRSRTDDAGVIVFEQLVPAAWNIAADRGGTALAEVAVGRVNDVEVVIPRGILVRGRVLDEHDAPIAGASVWLSRRKHDYCNGSEATTSDAAGRFMLRDVEAKRFVSASSPGRRSAVARPVRGTAGSTVDIDLLLAGAGATLRGTVRDADDGPCSNARVFVGWHDQSFRWTDRMFAEYRPPVETCTDANGMFVAHGLAAGSNQPLWVRAPAHCVWYQRIAIAADGDTRVDVRLQRGATLSGRVTDAVGHALAEAGVDYRSSAWYSARGWFPDLHGPSWAFAGALTDADGSYQITGITPGALQLRARKDTIEAEGGITVSDGDAAKWDAVLVERVIRGRIVDERGAPLPNVEVSATPPRGQGNFGAATSDADGKFVCETLAAVPYVLTFYPAFPKECGGERVLALTLRGTVPSADELVVRIPDQAFAVGTLRGRWLDSDGTTVKVQVRASAAGQRREPSVDTEPATGEFVLGPLPVGTWRLQAVVVAADGGYARCSAWSQPFELRAGEVRDAGTLQMPVTGWIDVTATGPDGAALHLHSVAVEASTGWSETSWMAGQLDRGKLRIHGVAPGPHRIRVDAGNDLPACYAPVVVTAGTGTAVAVRVPKGVNLHLVLSPISEPAPMHLHYAWLRDGEPFQRYYNWHEASGEFTIRDRLPPGAYEVTVTSETGKRTVNHFTIAGGEPDGRKIAIQLP